MSHWIAYCALLVVSTGRPAAPDLASAAQELAGRLESGGIVTAELRDGATAYAAAGQPQPGGPAVSPERLVFEIGSISKVFTGLLLAQAVLDGKVGLDDPISRHLPADLRFATPAVGQISLVQLATHTSCLPRLPDNLAPPDPGDPYAAYDAAALHGYLARTSLDGTPPCPSDYSNLGMGLLGHVLERVYATSWGELVASRIAKPLGLADTVVELSDDQRRRLAPAWDGEGAAKGWTFQALAGAGALRSTAHDLVAFARGLETPGGPLAAAWALASRPRADLPASGTGVGLGVLTEERDGTRWFLHDGGTGGYRSLLRWSAEGATIRVVLINQARAAPQAVVARLEPEPERLERTEVPLPAAVLDEYVGVYELSRQSRFTVLREGDVLRARLTGQPFFPIHPWARDRFFYRAVPAEVEFERNAEGRVAALLLDQDGRRLRAERATDAPAPVLFPVAAELEAYVGGYVMWPSRAFDVTLREGTLFARLEGQPAFPVFMTGPDRFVYDVVEARLEFERDAAGRVAAVALHQHGMVLRAPRREPEKPKTPEPETPAAPPPPAPGGGASVGSEAALREEVRAAERAFAQTMVDRDHASFVSFLAEEAVFLGDTTLRGKAAVAAGWKRYFEAKPAPFSWEPERVEVLDSGTLAVTSGPVRDGAGTRIGTFNSVWRREADGRWRVMIDVGCPPCRPEPAPALAP